MGIASAGSNVPRLVPTGHRPGQKVRPNVFLFVAYLVTSQRRTTDDSPSLSAANSWCAALGQQDSFAGRCRHAPCPRWAHPRPNTKHFSLRSLPVSRFSISPSPSAFALFLLNYIYKIHTYLYTYVPNDVKNGNYLFQAKSIYSFELERVSEKFFTHLASSINHPAPQERPSTRLLTRTMGSDVHGREKTH